MRFSWLPALGSVVAMGVSGQAVAQVQAQPYDRLPYETPRYVPSVPPPLDKSYGLPTFGMPGTELPQQKTMATPVPLLDKADLLPKAPADVPFAKAPEWRPGGTKMETPLFTTSENAAPGYTTQFETGSFGTQQSTTFGTQPAVGR